VVDRRTSAENESNSDVANDDGTMTGQDDHELTFTDTVSQTSSAKSKSTSTPVVELEIQDIEGIGPTTAKKLK